MTRRTRKQKQAAKHPFLVSWKEDQLKPQDKAVKGQFKTEPSKQNQIKGKSKNAKLLDKARGMASIRHELFKSLKLASLILSLELMIYLVWKY